MMQKVYVLYTGGTIGCVGDPLSPMSGREFSAAFTELITPTIVAELPGTEVTIEYFDHTLDSTNMQPSEWVLMAERVAEKYEEYDDFLILHGTDTLAWTASALSFLLPGVSKTVTVTGSQLPLFKQIEDAAGNKSLQILFNTDAVRNVLGAVRFFTLEVPEVCVYFADQLFRGNRTVKSNSSGFLAFSSPNYHALGEYGVLPTLHSEYVRPVPTAKSMASSKNLFAVRERLAVIKQNISDRTVLQLQTFPGYYSKDGSESLLASMMKNLTEVEPPLGGVVFESYGIGNIPSYSSMQEQLQAMHDAGIVLIDCTQVFAGGVDYNEYATGAWLKERGVIGAQDMSAIAAMTKLTVLLAEKSPETPEDIEDIEEAMGRDLAGEMESYYSLSGYRNDFLMPGDSLFSVNGSFELRNSEDGYISVLDVSADDGKQVTLWKQGNGNAGRLKMQADNNLVFYDDAKNVNWASDTATLGFNSCLVLENDGSLKLYNLDTDKLYVTIYGGPGSENKGGKKKSRSKRKPQRVRHRKKAH